MIHNISGEIMLVEPNLVVLECNGIGYAVKTSMSTVSKLSTSGKTTLYTYLHVREDALELFGFADMQELNSFKMLISISGVGPKAAISVLSNMKPEQFALCVATGDAKSIAKAQGIGPKTAQRIVLELKDKITKEQLAVGVTGTSENIDVFTRSGNASEAISALVVLGYSQSEATTAIAKLDANMPVDEMIKNGLKALASKL